MNGNIAEAVLRHEVVCAFSSLLWTTCISLKVEISIAGSLPPLKLDVFNLSALVTSVAG